MGSEFFILTGERTQSNVLFESLTQDESRFIAEAISFVLRRGDLVALRGDLGTGKTTFARAVIQGLAGDVSLEIPSPTYTLVQHYDTARMTVAHFDLYRISDPNELDELGLDHSLEQGAVLVEWPARAGDRLPQDRLEICLDYSGDRECADGACRDTRSMSLVGIGSWRERLDRFAAMVAAIEDAQFSRGDTRVRYLQGDASARRYARLSSETKNAIVMDWPLAPEERRRQSGSTYDQPARLAVDIEPFLQVSSVLRKTGFSAPEIYSGNSEHGILVLEDLGDRVFQNIVSVRGSDNDPSQAEMWTAAVDVLVALRQVRVPTSSAEGSGARYSPPEFNFDLMMVEAQLLLEWYLPALPNASSVDKNLQQEFTALWEDVYHRTIEAAITPGDPAASASWVLRDYHSPNLIWLGQRDGVKRVGLIDFQDALRGPAAYDLVSLLQDARVDVPADLEQSLFDYYCSSVARNDSEFDRERFAFQYAALGAQRNTKILGIFARLAKRDQKPHYLAHIPRIWRYLERDLSHSELGELKTWYDRAIPKHFRDAPLKV